MAEIPQRRPQGSGSVQSRRVGGPPDVGKLGRISNRPNDPSGRRRRRKRRDGSRKESRFGIGKPSQGAVLRRWLILGLGIMGITVGILLVWILLNPSKDLDLSNRPGDFIAGADAFGGKVSILTATQATEISNQFLNIAEPEQLETLMRPGTLSPGEAVGRIKEFRNQHGGIQDVLWVKSLDSLTIPMEVVLVRFVKGQQELLFLTPNDQGDWVVDFEASLYLGDQTLEYLDKHQAENVMVRVIAKEDSYYNGPFRDEKEWACFKLIAPRADATLFGYCRKKSAKYEALLAIEKKFSAITQATTDLRNREVLADPPEQPSEEPEKKDTPFRTSLKISKHPEAYGNQFFIDSVLSDDWVIPRMPLDQVIQNRVK